MKNIKLSTFLLVLTSPAIFAYPFDIYVKEGTQLPTSVVSGLSATAYYTVQNNTKSKRNGNFIKYLPLNVAQVTSGGVYSDTCGTWFDLAPSGQPGDSCTLQLNITGEVDANDPNPHHHLFAAFPKGKTCGGTNQPLNVRVNNISAPNYAYITNPAGSSYPSVFVCKVNNGQLSDCNNADQSGFFNSIGLQGVVVNNNATIAYFSRSDDQPYVEQCNINQADGKLVNCQSIQITSPAGYDPYYGLPALNADNSAIFLPDVYTNLPIRGRVLSCPINNGVVSSTCTIVAQDIGDNAVQIAFNPNNPLSYVGSDGGREAIYVCNFETSSVLSAVSGGGSIAHFGSPSGLAINPNPNNQYIYITNYNGTEIYKCTLDFQTCSTTVNVPVYSAYSITIDARGEYAYAADYRNTVYSFKIDQTTGDLSYYSSLTGLTGLNDATQVAVFYLPN